MSPSVIGLKVFYYQLHSHYLLWFVNLYKYRPINLHPCQVQSRAKKPLTSDKLDGRLACRLYLITCHLYLAAGPRCWISQPAKKNKKQIKRRASEDALSVGTHEIILVYP